jgi:hypothetical protein
MMVEGADVWQLQEALTSTDASVQKEALRSLLSIDSEEAVFICRRFLSSCLYEGAPADLLTDLLGVAAFAFGPRSTYKFRSWEIQVRMENDRLVEVSGLRHRLLKEPQPFEKATQEDFESHEYWWSKYSGRPAYTPREAVGWGQIERLEFLIEQGADAVGCTDRYGGTLLHEAARTGKAEIARVLLEAGASADARAQWRSVEGVTPLMLAAEGGQLAVVEVLTDYGAAIDARDQHGCTALVHASELIYPWQETGDRVRVMELLVQRGADQTVTEEQWRAAFPEARQYLSPPAGVE